MKHQDGRRDNMRRNSNDEMRPVRSRRRWTELLCTPLMLPDASADDLARHRPWQAVAAIADAEKIKAVGREPGRARKTSLHQPWMNVARLRQVLPAH